MLSLETAQQKCDVNTPDALSQDVEHWGNIILKSISSVLFEIRMTRMIRMVRTVLISSEQPYNVVGLHACS